MGEATSDEEPPVSGSNLRRRCGGASTLRTSADLNTDPGRVGPVLTIKSPQSRASSGCHTHLIGELLTKIGFDDVHVTKPVDDGGIDLFGTLVTGGVIGTRMAVQVKRWKHNVQAPTVQQLPGALGAHDQGVIITTSGFSAGAREEAGRPDRVPVALMNGEELVGLLVEHQILVVRRELDLLELGDDDEPVTEA